MADSTDRISPLEPILSSSSKPTEFHGQIDENSQKTVVDQSPGKFDKDKGIERKADTPLTSGDLGPAPQNSAFTRIPPELIDTILGRLSSVDLATVSATCHILRRHALSNAHWRALVQENVPGVTVTSPGPCSSFRDLYTSLDRVWFLPKFKIWFCDRDLMGKLIVVLYDPRRGCIDGYQLVARRGSTESQQWTEDTEVMIHGFQPTVRLHLDKPLLLFRARPNEDGGRFLQPLEANRYADEMPMELDGQLGATFSNFILTRPLDTAVANTKLAIDFPYGDIWPSPAVPARHHVVGLHGIDGQQAGGIDPEHRPRRRSEVSDQTFRIRQWMEMNGSTGFAFGLGGLIDMAGSVGVHIGEEVSTYSTLDPYLYTPTVLRPWRGIWVGDYSGHGCEFLLIHQPDDEPATDVELGLFRNDDESDTEWETRKTEARIYRGRLEAIKLTGDPNVPRGEYTFIAEDLGPGGSLGLAADPPFTGARVVQSKGHVADAGFVDGKYTVSRMEVDRVTADHKSVIDKFIESQLILISHDRLAQYWVGFGHISYFERVNIDDLIVPP
ncbi:hypothetical protein G7046_g2696 [Stylonectria norvegica]|nr:hypothetical protein G7046_g2696 [Stylonectria norvegica]